MTDEDEPEDGNREPKNFSDDEKSIVAETSEEDPRPGKGGKDNE